MIPDPLRHEHEITVLITCYNEEQLIGQSIANVAASLKAAGKDYEIIVIEDCSRDNSAEVIARYIAEHPDQNVRLHRNETNQGLSNNFLNGAFLGTGRHYRLCCGDDPELPAALEHIFSCVGKADLVIPYMVQKDVAGKSPLRVFISLAYTWIVNTLSGYRIGYYNGMPVFLRYHVLRFPPVTGGFGFQADLVTRLLEEGVSYTQVEHLGAVDRKGKTATALSMRNLLSVVHTFVEIAIRRVRRLIFDRRRPRAREVVLETGGRRP